MIEIEKYARAAASTARTPPNSPARRAALEAENAARVAAEQFVKGLEAECGALSAWKDEIEAQEPAGTSCHAASAQTARRSSRRRGTLADASRSVSANADAGRTAAA